MFRQRFVFLPKLRGPNESNSLSRACTLISIQFAEKLVVLNWACFMLKSNGKGNGGNKRGNRKGN